ncbi:MAG: DNA polymerase I [Candidatus Caenarcaniphilales bacterium]|nr:DNA polymerase I [Candidatus Caenarcaniphilales bacterium]
MPQETLLLIDGSNLAFRMYFALEMTNLRDSQGNPTWAVYGVIKSLFDAIEFSKPTMVAAAFDLPEPTYRHVMFEDYKANRPDEMPDELQPQWELIKESFRRFNIPVLEEPGYEADDMIGIMAKKAYDAGHKVVILSGDKDLFQLVNDRIVMAVPQRGGGLEIFSPEQVFEKMGVKASQVPDYKGIAGDSSDNIPGVKGLGPKAATKLLSEYETLEEIYQNINKIEPAKIKEKLVEQEAQARMCKLLATIIIDDSGVKSCDTNLEHCKMELPNTESLIEFLKQREFNSILKRLPIVLKPFNNGNLVKVDVGELPIIEKVVYEQQAPKQIQKVAEKWEKIETPLEKYQVNPFVILDEMTINILINNLKQVDCYAIDLETNGLNTLNCSIVGIAIAFKQKDEIKSFYIPCSSLMTKHLGLDNVLAKLKEVLEDSNKKQIIQNAKFEQKILLRYGIKMHNNFFDTMLASYVKNSSAKHGLKAQVKRVFHKRMTELEEILGTGRNQKPIETVDINSLANYAGADAKATFELYEFYELNLDEREKELLRDIEFPLVEVLRDIEGLGVALDKDFLQELSVEVGGKVKEAEHEACTISGTEFNLASPKQLSSILFDTMKFPIVGKKNKSGAYSTDADTLETLMIEELEDRQKNFLNAIMEHRTLSKLCSTYIDSLPSLVAKEDNRLHSDFNQVVTATGRLSSSNPNLQNIPIKSRYGKQVRKAFTTQSNEFKIISADYSQIELRVLAHLADEPFLIDAFQQNQDIHKRTAMEIFECSENEVDEDKRRIGKTLNFALIYMQGPFATAKQLGISQKEAKQFIDRYFTVFTRIKPYMDKILYKAHQDEFVETMFGRRRYFENINSPNKMLAKEEERQAFNAVIQGSAADIMKIAMINVHKALESMHSKLILQVHDELVIEAHQDELELVKNILLDKMSHATSLKVPLLVDIGVGDNWLEL